MAYVFTHATVLDGTADMEPRPNTTVVVNDEGRIAAIGAADEATAPANAQEIDLKGAYLVPGLVNLHVHLCGSGKPTSAGAAGDLIDKVVGNPIGMWYLRRIIKKHAQQQLASGVTTVRSVGDPGFADVDVRDAINAGKYQGPRLLTSGVGVTVPGGHGAGLFAHIAKTPEQAREIVRDCFARKCDLVKLFVTGGVFDAEKEGEPGVLRMSPEIAASGGATRRTSSAWRPQPTSRAQKACAWGLRRASTPSSTARTSRPSSSRCSRKTASVGSPRSPARSRPRFPSSSCNPEKTHSTEIQKVNGNIVYEGIVHAAQAALEAGIPVGWAPIQRAPTSRTTTCGAKSCTSSASSGTLAQARAPHRHARQCAHLRAGRRNGINRDGEGGRPHCARREPARELGGVAASEDGHGARQAGLGAFREASARARPRAR